MAVVACSLAHAQATTSDPDAERKADLVTAYKILVNEGILDSFGHVTVRSAKDPNIFFMPRAMPPALVSLDDILELRVSDSQPIDPKGRRVNGERYIHGEIYKARPDVMSVIHAHSQAVIPLSLTAIKMKPVICKPASCRRRRPHSKSAMPARTASAVARSPTARAAQHSPAACRPIRSH